MGLASQKPRDWPLNVQNITLSFIIHLRSLLTACNGKKTTYSFPPKQLFLTQQNKNKNKKRLSPNMAYENKLNK